MSFLVFAWASSLLYGLVTILIKITSKHSIKNQLLFNFVYSGSILLWTIPVALLNHAGLPDKWENIIITACCYVASGILYITAIYKLDVSTISPLYNFQTAFAVILSAIILHQILVPLQYLLIVIIFIAGLFTAIDEKFHIRSFFTISILTAIGATLALALADVFTNKALSENKYWTVSLWVPVITQTLLLATIPFFIFKKDIKKVSFKPVLALFLVGAFDMLGVLAANKAYGVNVALTAVIISLPISLLLVILFSIFYPKLLERHIFKVYAIRVIAALVMVLAALKLSLG